MILFKFIFISIFLKFVVKGPIVNKSALVEAMACHLTGNKPLPESMLTKSHDAIWCRHQATMC